MIVARCNIMQHQNWRRATAIPFRRIVAGEFSTDTVERQIMDFLDGETHEAELLHALYDHVLGEPIPERMRELLEK
jgi:hypothetical protein